MVGDYVFRDGYGIAKVFEVRTTSVLVQLASDGSIATWAHSIEPIPLTAEMLGKNGFVNKKGKFMQKGNFDVPPLIMWHLVDDKILGHPKAQLEIHYGGKGIHISLGCIYVHELQHNLRNIGLKDVANNFKL